MREAMMGSVSTGYQVAWDSTLEVPHAEESFHSEERRRKEAREENGPAAYGMASGHREGEGMDITPTGQQECAAKLAPSREFVKSIPAPEEWKVLFATEDITPEMWRKAVRVGVAADRWLDAHDW